MKLYITNPKHHSWYLCQISVQIMLLPILISPIVWNMCENLHYESVCFKELHNQQEYYWPTIYRTGAAVVSTITSFITRKRELWEMIAGSGVRGRVGGGGWRKMQTALWTHDFRVYLGVKTCEVFLCFLDFIFLGSIVLAFQWLLCIHCFTSLVSFKGFYTEDEPDLMPTAFIRLFVYSKCYNKEKK